MLTADKLLTGQETVQTILIRFLESQKIPHALLFTGESGAPKTEMITAFAKTLLCDEGGLEPCGHCESCLLFQAETHPDFLLLKPAGRLRQVGRGQINDLLQSLSLKPYREGYRVIALLEADRLGVAAANALLKSLEEPAPQTVFLLTATREADVLPTIRSRCQKLELIPLPEKEIESLLSHEKDLPLPAPVLARLARGYLGRVTGQACTELLENRERILELLDRWSLDGDAALLQESGNMVAYLETLEKQWKKEALAALKNTQDTPEKIRKKGEGEMDADVAGHSKRRQDEILQCLAEILRDALLLESGLPESLCLHQDQLPKLRELQPRLPDLSFRLEQLDIFRRRLKGTANRKLTWDALLLQCLQEGPPEKFTLSV